MNSNNKQLSKTEDLGQGYFVNFWSDGSMTFRNPDVGMRVDLTPESAETLRSILTTK